MSLLNQADRWCLDNLPPRPGQPPLQLLNVRPTDTELADHPRSLAIAAYFAGARHAAGEELQRFPRPLTAGEAGSWMDGWAEHRTEHVTAVTVPLAPLLAGEAA